MDSDSDSEQSPQVSVDVQDLLRRLVQADSDLQETKKELEKAKQRRYVPSIPGQRVVARRYDSHHMNDGVDIPDMQTPNRENLFVYCRYCKKTNKLTESAFVTFPLDGNHWVCRQHQKEHGLVEYVAK